MRFGAIFLSPRARLRAQHHDYALPISSCFRSTAVTLALLLSCCQRPPSLGTGVDDESSSPPSVTIAVGNTIVPKAASMNRFAWLFTFRAERGKPGWPCQRPRAVLIYYKAGKIAETKTALFLSSLTSFSSVSFHFSFRNAHVSQGVFPAIARIRCPRCERGVVGRLQGHVLPRNPCNQGPGSSAHSHRASLPGFCALRA